MPTILGLCSCGPGVLQLPKSQQPWPYTPTLNPLLGHTKAVGGVTFAEPFCESRHLAAQHLVLAEEPIVLQGQLILCWARGALIILLWKQLIPDLRIT